MHSHILKIAAKQLLLPFLFISIVILYRGHNQPGGGFIGGLVAASAFILYNVAFGVQSARKALLFNPQKFIGFGLACAIMSALLSFFFNKPLMTSLWADIPIPFFGHFIISTPMLFDSGVYLVVLGVVLTIVFALSEETR